MNVNNLISRRKVSYPNFIRCYAHLILNWWAQHHMLVERHRTIETLYVERHRAIAIRRVECHRYIERQPA